MTIDRKPRPISGLDRRWMGANGVIFATGVRARPAERARALFREFMQQYPEHVLACRIDRKRRQWVPVPPEERESHIRRLVIAVEDPAPVDVDSHVRAHIDALPPDLPFLAAVGPTSIFAIMCHAVGDGVTIDRLTASLFAADAAEDIQVVGRLAALEPRMSLPSAARGLVRDLPEQWRDWVAHTQNPVRSRLRGGGARGPRPTGPARPAFASVVVGNDELRGLLRWRNREAGKASIAAVLTCATYRALAGQGLGIDPNGYYAILDLRPYLEDDSGKRFGNGAKSLRLTADLRNPMEISTALKDAGEAHRVLPAVVLASPMRQRLPAPPPTAGRGGSLALTFTFQPTTSEMPRLPALPGLPRTLYGFGTPASAGGVSMFAVRLREHMQITASFDERTVPMETVRKALAALADPRSVLEGPAEPTHPA